MLNEAYKRGWDLDNKTNKLIRNGNLNMNMQLFMNCTYEQAIKWLNELDLYR